MSKSASSLEFLCGARGSRLSIAQAKGSIAFLGANVPGFNARLLTFDTPGDRDLSTPIERSAPDFFTRDLDDAVRSGAIDFAIHSAKDLPDPIADGLDWFWLPNREDPRDCWVARADCALLAKHSVRWKGAGLRIGVSSERRRAFAMRICPKAVCSPIRGAVDSRLAQLRSGRFDAALMAVAGLKRLFPDWDGGAMLPADGGVKLATRIIGIDELPPPEGQGYIAIVFRKGDRRLNALRLHFIKAVRFTSAGVGDAGLITVRGARDVEEADIVLSDALSGFGGIGDSPKWVNVGKRCGSHSMAQEGITRLICDEARKGKRVVRLKGGDAGLFGRLAEETAALDDLGIPYAVRPGVSALAAATSPNGILLTKRGEARGFAVSTPRSSGSRTPQVFFMATRVARETLGHFPPDERYAMVWDAYGPNERVETGLCGSPRLSCSDEPGLLVVGYAGTPFSAKRILLTCSDAVMPHAVCRFEDMGWRTIPWPMIELRACDGIGDRIANVGDRYDAIVLTSPSAARIFFEKCACDLRSLPKLWTCGSGTDAELRRHGVASDIMPSADFSAAGLVARLRQEGKRLAGLRVLRLRSAKAGGAVASALRRQGVAVDDVVLYDNVPVLRPGMPQPACDAVFFASSSAVESYISQYGARSLSGRKVYVIGEPTRQALPVRMRKGAVLVPLAPFKCRLV